jgi:iron complex transport system substrate-binding protein
MKIIEVFIAIMVVALLTLAGCQVSAPQGYTVTDDVGRNVSIKDTPQRIISLSPSNTEIVYALGLEDKLVGVTSYDNYPEAAKDKPEVSDYSTVDIEKVVSYQPDLILASNIHEKDTTPAFEKLGITVLTVEPRTVDNMFSDMLLLGRICGRGQQATNLVSGLNNRIKAVTDKTGPLTDAQRPRVFFLTWHDPLWTDGSGTAVSEIITCAGGANIAADLNGYSQIDLESVIQRNPQIILVMSSMGDQNTSYNYILTEPRFQSTDALKNNQVYKVDADIFGRTTPRLIDGLETLAELTHPEMFK